MKFVKNLFVMFLAFCMTAGLCAAPSAAIAAASDEDLTGEYTAFAAERLGMMTALENLGGSSSITLNADGTGTFVFNGEESSITAWKFEDGKVTITVEGDEAAAEYKDGTLALDLGGDGTSLFHYAKEGVDTSGYDLKSLEEIQAGPDSKTNAAFKAIDTEAGAHLSYEVHLDSLNSDTLYDVHAKGGTYQQLMNYSKDARYTEEKREYNGISYDAEVFAETKYSPGIAFSFGEDGQLAFVETSPFTTASGTELPVQLYTIHSIDGTIDESLLDISAYTIVEE